MTTKTTAISSLEVPELDLERLPLSGVSPHINQIIHGDCLEVMPGIPNESIDMILCDLPYGTTQCSWDTVIPFEPLWEAYKRVIKPNGAIVLTAIQPFAAALIMSNIQQFRYEWIWRKNKGTNFLDAKKRPLRNHENVLMFSAKAATYYPVRSEGHEPMHFSASQKQSDCYGEYGGSLTGAGKTWRYPQTVMDFPMINNVSSERSHPTQKPVALFEYLIRTYTNTGEVVLDNCIGGGTTAVAAIRTNRRYMGIELEQKYVDITEERIRRENAQLKFDMFVNAAGG